MAYIGKRPQDTFPSANAVTSTIIAENAVSTSEIALNSITTNLIADNAVTDVKIAENTIKWCNYWHRPDSKWSSYNCKTW